MNILSENNEAKKVMDKDAYKQEDNEPAEV